MSKLGLLNEPGNIIELFTFDLTSFFFEEDFEEIDCSEDHGMFMIEYKKDLPWLELDLFTEVIFRIFNDKVNLEGSSHINVKFPANPDLVSEKLLKKLINTLFKVYGWDDESNGEWNGKDIINFKLNKLERIWTLGEGRFIYSVKVTQDETGLVTLNILFFNHLLKLANQKISYATDELSN